MCLILNEFIYNINEIKSNDLKKFEEILKVNVYKLLNNYMDYNMSFKAKEFDKYLLEDYKNYNIEIIIFLFSKVKNDFFPEREIKDFLKFNNYYKFFLDDDKKNKNDLLKIAENNKFNIIKFFIFDNISSFSFEDIFKEIIINKYDYIFIIGKPLISKDLVQFTSKIIVVSDYLDLLEKIKGIKSSLELIEKKIKIMAKRKFWYYKLIDTYIQLTHNKIQDLKDNEEENLHQKINEIIFFMLNQKIIENSEDNIKNIEYIEMLFADLKFKEIIKNLKEDHEKRIIRFLKSLKKAYNNDNINLSLIESKMRNKMEQSLSQSLIRFFLKFIKESFIPKLSLRIWISLLSNELKEI